MKTHGKWVRTIKCGCGNCQQRPDPKMTCPMENSKDAIWLWASDFSTNKEEDLSVEVKEDHSESEEHSPVPEVFGRVESRVS